MTSLFPKSRPQSVKLPQSPVANETAVTESTSQAAIENASQPAREVSEKEMDDEFLHLSIRVGATGRGER